MRINKYIATYSDLSRRKADDAIASGRVIVNRQPANSGMDITSNDVIIVDGKRLIPIKQEIVTVLLNKPTGYVCSRDGQGSPTVYDLLPKGLQRLNIAGRLDKDSSGLVVLSNDGNLLNTLSHPRSNKEKVYVVRVDEKISDASLQEFVDGIDIGDSRKAVATACTRIDANTFEITLVEGRNRQIRRMCEVLKYSVTSLHRTALGEYSIDSIREGSFVEI